MLPNGVPLAGPLLLLLLLLEGILQLEAKTTKRCPSKFLFKEGECIYDNIEDTHYLEDEARDACAAIGSKLLVLGNYYICEAASIKKYTITQTPTPLETSNNEGTIAWILVLTFLIGLALMGAVIYIKICLKNDDSLVSSPTNVGNEEHPSIVVTEIDEITEPPSQSHTIDDTDSPSSHYDTPPARIEAIEQDGANTNAIDNPSYEHVGETQLTDNIYEIIEEDPLPQNNSDEDYDQPTALRPIGEVPNHYILNSTGLRRSALRSSTSAFQLPSKLDRETSQPPLPAFNSKGRFSFNCSRSSNEHNITKSEEASNYIMFFKKFKEKGFADWLKDENTSKSSSLKSVKSDDGYVDIKINDVEVSINYHV